MTDETLTNDLKRLRTRVDEDGKRAIDRALEAMGQHQVPPSDPAHPTNQPPNQTNRPLGDTRFAATQTGNPNPSQTSERTGPDTHHGVK